MKYNRKIDYIIVETVAGRYEIGGALECIERIKYKWRSKVYEIKTDRATYIFPYDRVFKLEMQYSEVY